jgi:hypothetical protein
MTSYLFGISKQVEKNGNQINKITMMVQSIQKQKPTRTAAVTVVGWSQAQFVKQIKSQTSQLRKQVARIQNDNTHLSMLRSME